MLLFLWLCGVALISGIGYFVIKAAVRNAIKEAYAELHPDQPPQDPLP